MELTRLNWDSDFFNLEVGKIVLDTDNFFQPEELNVITSGYDLVYIFTENKEPENYGLKAIDKKVVFEMLLDDLCCEIMQDISVYEPSESNYSKLLELAYLSGKYSRFRLDKSFGETAFKKLYKTWIDKFIASRFNGRVFVKLIHRELVGFITIETIKSQALIGLIAVDPKFQGQGIANQLLQKSLNFAKENGVKKLVVTTQNDNTPAMKLYSAFGFSIKSKTNIYHYWKK